MVQDWIKKQAPWEIRKARAEREKFVNEIREEIQAKMRLAEKEQEKLENERLKELAEQKPKSLLERTRENISGWFGRRKSEAVEREPENTPEVDEQEREATFTVPKGTRSVKVTIKKSDGTQSTYTISSYISIGSGDILHVRAL